MRRIGALVIAACVVAGSLSSAGTANASNGINFDIAELESLINTSQSMLGTWQSAEGVKFHELNLCDRKTDAYNAEMQAILNVVRKVDGAIFYWPAGGLTFEAGPQLTCRQVKRDWVIETNGHYEIRAVYLQSLIKLRDDAAASGWHRTEAAFNPFYTNP